MTPNAARELTERITNIIASEMTVRGDMYISLVRRALSDVLHIRAERINDHASIGDDYGCDSLAFMQLVTSLEKLAQCEITLDLYDTLLWHCQSVPDPTHHGTKLLLLELLPEVPAHALTALTDLGDLQSVFNVITFAKLLAFARSGVQVPGR